jgi:N4-gp56 family major capsid protein
MSAQQRNHYSKIQLARFLPSIPMLGQGMQSSIPQGEGTTIEWRYLAPFARSTTPLVEDTPPSDSAMVWSKVTATTAMYGAWTKISKLAQTQAIDPQVAAATAAFGENAGQTLHTVCINVLAAGTNVRYAGAVAGRSSVAAANVYSAAEVRRARRLLSRANVKGYSDGFHALIHPDVMESLNGDSTVEKVAQYGSGGIAKQGGVNLLTGEVMTYGGFKYMESTDAPVFAGAGSSGIDVYGTLHFGPNWFGEVDLLADPVGTANSETNRVSGLEPVVIPADSNDKVDPLNQYGVVGWKALGVAYKVLQEARGLRTESSAAA